MSTFSLVVLIAKTALGLLADYEVGGKTGVKTEKSVGALLEIISQAKTAVEAETGKPLDVSKIKPFVPIP